MANKKIFKSAGVSKNVPVADTVNKAGGRAYTMSQKHALAQIACTNCFNGTFYTSAEDNLAVAKKAALDLIKDQEFIAKVAVYSRDKGYMKDMPAFLTVVLADTDTKLFRKVFRKVIDNGKMLRNFIQMARSGAVTGRVFNMSSGACRRAIQEWFDSRSPYALFKASIGNDPSMRDILRMARPKPNTPDKEALFGYFLGKKVVAVPADMVTDKEQVALDRLPEIVRQYEVYKSTGDGEVPNVDFRLLDSLNIGDKEWTQIALRAPWQMTRMNLNTFARHNVFKSREATKAIADRLRNTEEIQKARQFPYQLYTAWKATVNTDGIPSDVREALQDAMEISIDNVPVIPGQVYVCMDMSGSMSSPVTGTQSYSYNGRTGSLTTCVDVAGLFASAVARKNRSAEIWTFSNDANLVRINPRDTVITNTQKLARAGGGTNISAPLRRLNANQAKGDVVIYVSDYESWIDSGSSYSWYGGGTALATEWEIFKKRNPHAKLVCIDLTPRNNSQVKEKTDILQIGGFSDQVFEVVASFVEHGFDTDHWVSEIEKVSLD